MQSRVGTIFEILSNTWPNAQCELIHHNAFQLLIAVVLSAQATDKSVNKSLSPLFKKYPDFSSVDLFKMGEKNFLEVIRSIGLAPTKAKNCFNLSSILLEKHSGEVSLKREDLESLPGVGRKTANVILNVLCGLPTMAVDTHVERVSKRLGVVPMESSRLEVEKILLKRIPKKYLLKAHHLLIFHGRYHCTARKPKCENCPVNHLCHKIGV